jgi:hypothetical protein
MDANRRMLSGIPNWFTALFIGLCVAFSGVVFAFAYGGETDVLRPLLTAALLVVCLLLFRVAAPSLYFDGDCLYITRWWKKATISVEEVSEIIEIPRLWPFRPSSATIHFRSDTPFGRSVYLGAPGGVPSFIFPSVLADLRQTIAARTRAQQSVNLSLRKS